MSKQQTSHDAAFKIGILGPSGCGKSLLVSTLESKETLHCSICQRRFNETQDKLHLNSPTSSLNPMDSSYEVISVVVREPGPLGVKIGKHRTYKGFSYVKAFMRKDDMSSSTSSNEETSSEFQYELEKSGKVAVGDLVVAVNRQTLLHLSQEEIAELLRGEKNNKIRVITFLRVKGSVPQIDDTSTYEATKSNENSTSGIMNFISMNDLTYFFRMQWL